MKARKKKKKEARRRAPKLQRDGVPLLEPVLREPVFESFDDLAKACDALIAEFYRYYRESSQDEPNMFGFVSVRHVVKFTDQTDSIYTENVVGQKTTVIYAPEIEGESIDEREQRRLSLLVAFDHTKRASHVLALTLLMSLLRGGGLKKLMEKQSTAIGRAAK